MADNKENLLDTEKEHQSNIDKNDDPKINNASVHNQKLDINSNVGSFVNVEEPIADGINEIDVTDKSAKLGTIKEQDKLVNFEKFKNVKRKSKKQHISENKFMIKIGTWLRNDRTLKIVWMFIGIIMCIILALSISMVTTITLDWTHKPNYGPLNLPGMHTKVIVAQVFSYISLGCIVLPLLYLFITILVGINGVYRSQSFHLFLWICLLIAFICMGVSAGFGSYIIIEFNSFHLPTI